eukprot:3230796-Pyramimonas_sp.AAC.1
MPPKPPRAVSHVLSLRRNLPVWLMSENARISVTNLSSTTWPMCLEVSDVLAKPGGRVGNLIDTRSSLGAQHGVVNPLLYTSEGAQRPFP